MWCMQHFGVRLVTMQYLQQRWILGAAANAHRADRQDRLAGKDTDDLSRAEDCVIICAGNSQAADCHAKYDSEMVSNTAGLLLRMCTQCRTGGARAGCDAEQLNVALA